MTTRSPISLLLPLSLLLAACQPEEPSTDDTSDDPSDDTGATDTDTPPDTDGDPDTDVDTDDDAPRETVEVIAGETSTGAADGLGTAARFNGPSGAVLSPDGDTIYVADTFNSLIRTVDVATGRVETLAGQRQVGAITDGTGTAATFQSPRAMAISPDGSTLYIADAETIRTLDTTTLAVTTVAGTPGERDYVDDTGPDARFGFLQHSYNLSADGTTLYISDRSNKVLRAANTSNWAVSTLAGDTYEGFAAQHADGTGDTVRFAGIGGLARIGTDLYIADTFNQSIRKYDAVSGAVTTVAGDPDTQGNADGIGAAASFDIPQSLAGDANGLYVVGFNGLLRRLNPSTAAVDTVLGVFDDVRPVDGPASSARLGIAFGPPLHDPDEDILYYNDRDASSLRTIDLDTFAVSTLAGAKEPIGSADGVTGTSRMNGPRDVVCTGAGDRCWITDSGNHTVRLLDRGTGTLSTWAGSAGEPGAADGALSAARFAGPTGLALSSDESTLYVADTANATIRAIDLSAGTVSTLAGSPELTGNVDGVGSAARFDAPSDLALTPDDSALLVADPGSSVIRRITLASATVDTLAGIADTPGTDDGAQGVGTLRSPGGLAVSADGTTAWVADGSFFWNGIRAIDLATGALTTVAGSDDSGVADGPLASALFDSPDDLLLTDDGTLHVVDLGSGTVRGIDLGAGTVSTWLGNPVVQANLPSGVVTPLADATFFFPTALAAAGDDFIVLAEDAALVVRP